MKIKDPIKNGELPDEKSGRKYWEYLMNKLEKQLNDIDDIKIKDSRIAALEALLRKLVDKCEFIGQYIRSDGEPSQGRCPICYAGSLQGKHKTDCEFLKARAVLEGK